MTNEPAPMGHNNPPSDEEILRAKLTEANKEHVERARKLIDAADRLPAEARCEEEAQNIVNYMEMIKKLKAGLEKIRVAEKEPFLSQGRTVDSFFGEIAEKMATANAKANAVQTKWLKKKADEEKAERDRVAAIKAKEAADAAEAARKEREALESATPFKVGPTVTERVAAEAAKDAEKAQKAAEAKPAALAKTRGSGGATASLRTEWMIRLDDRATLDLEVLRHHFSDDAIQKALNSHLKTLARPIVGQPVKGAYIWEESKAVTR